MSHFQLFALNSFKRDAKRRWEVLLSSAYVEGAYCLINGVPMPEKYKGHELKGDWAGFRECHIQPDMLLIYERGDDIVAPIKPYTALDRVAVLLVLSAARPLYKT